jgi:hypothetical protein
MGNFIMAQIIAGITMPDSKLAHEVEDLVRDTESELLFHHSNRVFLFGALTGQRKNLKVDPELLYIGAMFHDMGLQPPYASKTERFEVDSANAAAAFMHAHNFDYRDIEDVWDAISLHTTPGIPQHKRPVVALVTAGVEMDVLGLQYDAFAPEQRQEVLASHPRGHGFKNGIIDAFTSGNIKKPETTFGNVNADVLALRDPAYKRMNFCDIILHSSWED